MSDEASTDVASLTVQLLSAYLSNNTVPSSELAELIATTRSALGTTADTGSVVEEQTYEPAISVRKSTASRDHIISLIDGKPYKMLKRHLSLHGLTPAEYRARYNLPSDYPMVAANYSERRREVAKTLGLGRKGRQVTLESSELPADMELGAKPDLKTSEPTSKAKVAKKAPTKTVASSEPVTVEMTSDTPKNPRKAKTKATAETPAGIAPATQSAEISEVTADSKPKAGRKPKAKTEALPAATPAAKKTAKPKAAAKASPAATTGDHA